METEALFNGIVVVIEAIGIFAAVLGLVVVIRTVLGMSIQIEIEIEGTLPWRPALPTSGAAVIASEASRGRHPESRGA